MSTVLFADRDGAALGPLGARTIPALLPLGATPVLEKNLEALVAAGIRTALLVVGPRGLEVERRFGKGIRWGIALEYVRVQDGESALDVLKRVEGRLDGDTLVVRADVDLHEAIGEFVDGVADRTEPAVAATRDGRLAGLWRLAPGALKKAGLPREPASEEWQIAADHAALELKRPVRWLDSVSAYRAADRAATPAVSDRAEVDKRAALGPGSTVAEEAVVLSFAKLNEVSVLSRSVVPSGVTLQNAVVAGNLVVDGTSGAPTALSDHLPPRSGKIAGGGRLGGLAAFVLSLPLWPVAFGWSFVANSGRATRAVVLNGNAGGTDAEGRPRRAPFQTFLFETAVPILRDLPLLLSVVSGKLSLTGVAPLTPQEEAALTGWEAARLEARPGLLSRSRMVTPPGAPPEVARLVDAFDARGGTSGVVALALSRLASARAVTAPKAWNPDQLAEPG